MKQISKLLFTTLGLGILTVVLVVVNPVGAQNRNGAAPVTVENTASEPALVRDVDNARAPFQTNCGIQTTSDSGAFTCQLATVAAGRRLVIETISGFLLSLEQKRKHHRLCALRGHSTALTGRAA
jgi:hypothetical protein